MVVRKADISNQSYRVTSPLYGAGDMGKKVSASGFRTIYNKAKADTRLKTAGANVLKLAYTAAKAKAGGDPTRLQISEQISKAIGSLTNERAKGRVNDNYIDKREAGLVKGEVAAALYKLVDSGALGKIAPTPAKELAARASFAKIAQAVKNLSPIIDAGFKAYDPDKDTDFEGPAKFLRAAANDAGLSASGRAAILTALNGASSRGDGDGFPGPGGVKALLTSALAKLKASDGAAIVDLAKPTRAPTSRKDGTVTGLELDRTPAATGMTSRALLEYAATL